MIEVNNLTKIYNKKHIFNNTSISITTNQIAFLLGGNGIGKTTFIKCLLNLENFKGRILYDNHSYATCSDTVFSIFDDNSLYTELNGWNNIELFLSNIKYSKQDVIDYAILSQEKLKQKTKYYSLGERKKLFLIINKLKKPKYLIIDEITNGLDFDTLEWLKKELVQQSKDTLIISTGHNFNFYEDIVNEVFIINNANIIPLGDLKQNGGKLDELYKKYIQKH